MVTRCSELRSVDCVALQCITASTIVWYSKIVCLHARSKNRKLSWVAMVVTVCTTRIYGYYYS